MNYKDLKDGQRVNVYIPAMNRFYKMDVTSCEMADDGLGGFTISNYGARKNNLIDGSHEYLGSIRNQEDVDNFFYMQKEVVTGRGNDLSFVNAEAHYQKNGKRWIF